jgi:hypothetical protein
VDVSETIAEKADQNRKSNPWKICGKLLLTELARCMAALQTHCGLPPPGGPHPIGHGTTRAHGAPTFSAVACE